MKSEKESNKNLASNLLARISALVLIFLVPSISSADPIIQDVPLPPASFTHVEDRDILEKIGLDPGPAWCYDSQANAIIITAPARERQRCELRLMYELEKQKTKYEFDIKRLEIRIDTLQTQYDDVVAVKNKEIDRLTAAALKRPNDNNAWWATGGVIVGVATTLLVGWAVGL